MLTKLESNRDKCRTLTVLRKKTDSFSALKSTIRLQMPKKIRYIVFCCATGPVAQNLYEDRET